MSLNFRRIFLAMLSLTILVIFSACNGSGSDLIDDIKDAIDLETDPPSRKPISTSQMGVNNFFVDRQFGGVADQHNEIRNVLGLRFVRVLFAWSDAVQPSPGSSPNYSFYDAIINSAPSGVDILPVLVHTPAWMADSANWVDGDPRKTFVERWVRPTVQRYAGNSRIIGWEIWNEPDLTVVASDSVLGLEDPANYASMLEMATPVVRSIDPAKLVIMAATRSIQQNFPNALNYNKSLRDMGVGNLTDVWNIHYYSEQFENVVRSDGVEDFLNSLSKSIWITESGEQGPTKQLEYVETVWPFLRERIPAIDRIYYYEYGSPASLDANFGLRTTDAAMPVSDLYTFLRDR